MARPCAPFLAEVGKSKRLLTLVFWLVLAGIALGVIYHTFRIH